MKLTIKRIDFLKMLTYAALAIPAKSAEMQFLNFLIDVTENEVNIVASNGDLSTKITLGIKDEKDNTIIYNLEPGCIQTQAKLFLECISKMGGEVITLNMVDSNLLNLSDDTTNFNLVTRAGEEYPDVNLVIPEEKKGLTVKISDFKKLFDATAFAAATRGPKELFQGINIRANDGKLYFLATDSYRMARYAVALNDTEVNVNFTSPVKALDMVSKISEDGDCTIYFDDQRALFVSNGITLSTRLIRGEFPSADKIIPSAFDYSCSLKTKDFLDAADLIKIVSSIENKNCQARLILNKDGGATLTAKSANYGDGKVTLKGAVLSLPEEQNVFEIGFNVDYVVASVKALNSDTFPFEFVSPTRMFMVKNDDVENIQIVTPIRMNAFEN